MTFRKQFSPILGLNPTVWLISGPCCTDLLSDVTLFTPSLTQKSQASESQAKSRAGKSCSFQPPGVVPRIPSPILPPLPPQASYTPRILGEEWPGALFQGWGGVERWKEISHKTVTGRGRK